MFLEINTEPHDSQEHQTSIPNFLIILPAQEKLSRSQLKGLCVFDVVKILWNWAGEWNVISSFLL